MERKFTVGTFAGLSILLFAIVLLSWTEVTVK